MNIQVEIIDKINLVRTQLSLVSMAVQSIEDREQSAALDEGICIVQASLKELKDLAKDALASEDASSE
ncbi:hypothetical protein [Phyllobacterium chamaecytisi]|uniref:hypothetical protein n=1 Tax=Phyllobacterium chamaecytisi TaxID=2876082 RepID=UPI001CCC6559|nr:hypothetical protein [Phyllobacterium sp. KW56]MBZ9600777.1 hypothetical protein [Phyllobacterium sp. KW56]